jgi:hypothetical protein
VDAAGDVFVADTSNNAVKEVLPNGTILTIGSGFNFPTGVAVDAAGDVFVADYGNSTVEEVLPTGTIKTIGSGFSFPTGVAVDAAGEVFVTDQGNNRVVELSPPAVAATPSLVTDSTATAVSANLTGLSPDTVYYYRAVATGPGGTVADSSAQSFTTQVATSFANLTGGSIPFGTGSVNLSGQLATTPGTPFPTGSVVTVSIDGVAETATLNADGSFQLDYQFSAALNNLPLGVAQSPYAITYAYTDPSGTFAPASDSSQALTITQAAPKVGVADAGGTYDGAAFAASATVAGVVAGVDAAPAATLEGVAPSLSYYSGTYTSLAQLAGLTPLAGAPVNAGTYTVLATFAGSKDYASAQALATFTIAQAGPSVTVSDAGGAYNGKPFPGSATAVGIDGTTSVSGSFSYTYYVGLGTSGTTLGSTPPTNAGTYTVVATFTNSDSNYTGGSAQTTFTISPARLSAAAVTISATAGAPFNGTVATFTTPDQTDGAAAFAAVITWGDGSTSSGVITGRNGSFTVSGSHTYAATGSYAVSVQISNPDTQSATANDTATVTSLNRGVTTGMTAGIGFWHNKNGQALIDCFNGGPTATTLGNWLAASFPNLYGPSTGANGLAGKSNAQVAAYFQTLFAQGGTPARATALQVLAGGAGTTAAALLQGFSSPGGAPAQVLAVALNVYATTSSLGGNAGASYGFTVSATGLGARSLNVGQDGAAFGVANNSTLSVYGLLAAVNKQAVNGVLYGGNATLQAQCADLFSALDQAGAIG